jgi:hypothetical protein
MRARLVAALLLATSLPGFASGASHGYHSHSSHSSYHSQSSTRSYHPRAYSHGSEHVGTYTRRNGTTVHSYTHHPAGTTPSKSRAYHSTSTYHSRSARTRAVGERDRRGPLERSGAAKNAFKREHPCPSTGRTSGSCPGYVIDHVRALECNGADEPSNMQWQTATQGKAKDKTERSCR